MKYLLDSHTLLWTLDSPSKLSRLARQVIDDRASTLFVSIATPWELAIKTNSGRLDVRELLTAFDRSLSFAGYQLLETTVTQVVRAGLLPLHHRDPFDRLLAAQALELDLPLLSSDRIFDLYGVTRIWN
jgi:PIN domain nuclease of toxin-antitoxin system